MEHQQHQWRTAPVILPIRSLEVVLWCEDGRFSFLRTRYRSASKSPFRLRYAGRAHLTSRVYCTLCLFSGSLLFHPFHQFIHQPTRSPNCSILLSHIPFDTLVLRQATLPCSLSSFLGLLRWLCVGCLYTCLHHGNNFPPNITTKKFCPLLHTFEHSFKGYAWLCHLTSDRVPFLIFPIHTIQVHHVHRSSSSR